MTNQVTKKDCMEAIDYLWGMGMTQGMSSDKQHYTEILLKKVANVYKIKTKEQKDQMKYATYIALIATVSSVEGSKLNQVLSLIHI